MHPHPLMIPIRHVSTISIQMFFYAITKASNITFSIYILYVINMLFYCCFFCFSEIQFLEQNYDIAKCSIWMKKVTEIQNKVV